MEKILLQLKVFSLKNLRRTADSIISEINLPATIIFSGDLASGKTTLIREIVSIFRIEKIKVDSPTFNIVNQYKGKLKNFKIFINHFDLYRLDDLKELIDLPLDFYFKKNYLNLIEWGEKFLPQLLEYSKNLYIVNITRDNSLENEQMRIINLSLYQ